MNVHSETASPLTIQRMVHPDRSAEVSIFPDWRSACEHLQRHLLTAPECHAWAVLAPEITAVLDLDDAKARWSAYRQAIETRGASVREIYELFRRLVRKASTDAARLGWRATQDGVTVALGTDGVLVAIEVALKTAFLPGQGDPGAVVCSMAAGGPRPDSAAPPRGMRSGRRGAFSAPDGRGAREDLRRQASWSEPRKLFHGVFKPAVQFIRTQYHRDFDARGRQRLSDYGRLKSVLPPMSRLKFGDWLALRAIAGRS